MYSYTIIIIYNTRSVKLNKFMFVHYYVCLCLICRYASSLELIYVRWTRLKSSFMLEFDTLFSEQDAPWKEEKYVKEIC